MAKKRNFRKKQENTDSDQFEHEEEESTPIKLETILLGVVILILIFQTFLMLKDDGNNNAADTVTTNQPQPNVTPNNPSLDMNQNDPTAQSNPQPANDGPKAAINFPETDADLGTVSAGSETQHTFTVVNPGDIDIEFGRVYGDEGVTVISNPSTIPPGETGEIVISYTGTTPGADQKTIHVNANTETPHHHLTVNANVQ